MIELTSIGHCRSLGHVHVGRVQALQRLKLGFLLSRDHLGALFDHQIVLRVLLALGYVRMMSVIDKSENIAFYQLSCCCELE